MIVRFVIPSKTDPVRYEEWGAEAVPREGETVTIDGEPYRVTGVHHAFQTGDRKRPIHEVQVHLGR